MEYKKYKLGEIASFTQGKQVNINEQFLVKQEGMKRFIRIIDYTNSNEPIRYVKNFGKRYYVSSDEVAMIRYGSQTAGLAVMGKDGIIANNLFKISINNEIVLNKYIFYFLSQKFIFNYLRKAQSSSTMPAISFNIMNNLEIHIPNKECQRKIVKILSDIDKKILLNNEINNNLQEISKQLYKRWFVDFEFPNEDGQPYKYSGGKMIDSELGEIPENWNVVPFKDIAETINGYSYKGNELVDESNIGMVTIKNFDRNGGFKIDGYKSLSPQKIKEQCIVDLFDVAVAHTDLTQNADIIGNPIMILNKSKYDNLIISMDLVKVISKNDTYNNFMIFEILNSNHFKKFALGYVSGTTVLHLNKNCLKDYAMAMPDNNLIEKYSNIVEKNYNKIAALISENIILEQLRDTLLPKLMNGEINLDNVEI